MAFALLGAAAISQAQMRGQHALLVNAGSEGLTIGNTGYVHAFSTRMFVKRLGPPLPSPEVHVVIRVDGVIVQHQWMTINSMNTYAPDVMTFDVNQYVGPGVHFIEFSGEEYAEDIDDPQTFFYYTGWTS